MTANLDDLYLAWFFKGDFFKKIANTIETELSDPNSDKHFIRFFFAGNNGFANVFCNEWKKAPKKNETVQQKGQRIINLREMVYLKEMLLGAFFSKGGTGSDQQHWVQTIGALPTATMDMIKPFLHQEYANFRSSASCLTYISSLGIIVCPYCDKGIIDCTKRYFYGDLDHKKDKAGAHFYLSLNRHNLAPCCKVCNQQKSDSVLSFDPAHHTLDDLFTFTLDTRSIAALQGKYHPADINILLTPNPNVPELAQIYDDLNKAVKLEDRYNNMHPAVSWLYQMKRVMNPAWISTVNDVLGTQYTPQHAEKFILGNYNWHNSDKIQPLTKLINDLAVELELFRPKVRKP